MLPNLDPKQHARYETTARLSAFWFIRNQCKPEEPWGGIRDSADQGRYIYEYYPVSGWARGMGVWGQTVGIFACLACAEAVPGPSIEGKSIRDHCLLSAVRAARYMMTLQILDRRNERYYGAFREHNPQTQFSFPRDAATGAFGLLAMYRLTGYEEYLHRAILFADWYRKYGSDESGWPHVTFRFDTGEVLDADLKGIWQAGGGLVYHYLTELTGEKKWVEEGLRPIVERVLEMFAAQQTEAKGGLAGLHGMGGNDDFASLALLAAYLQFGEKKYLEQFAANMNALIANQHEDGSFRNYAGCYMAALEMLDAWQIREQLRRMVDETKLYNAIKKAADFGMSMQETSDYNPRMYGGMYGQTTYGVARDRIHQRSTGYGSVLYSRLVCEHDLPYWSALNWKPPAEKVDIKPYLDADRYSVG